MFVHWTSSPPYSGSPDQLGTSQKGPARHGKIQPGPGQRGDHAEPHGLRPEGQRSLPAATVVHLLPLRQRGGQHGHQLRRLGHGAPLGDEVEDGAGRVHRGPALPGLRRSGLQRAGAAIREQPEDHDHPREGSVPEETPLRHSRWAGGANQGEWHKHRVCWARN